MPAGARGPVGIRQERTSRSPAATAAHSTPRTPATVVLDLQRRCGNRTVSRLLTNGIVQAKRERFPGEPPETYAMILNLYNQFRGDGRRKFASLSPAAANSERKEREDSSGVFGTRYEHKPIEHSATKWEIHTRLKGSSKAPLYENIFDLETGQMTAKQNFRDQDHTPGEADAIRAALKVKGWSQAQIEEREKQGLGGGDNALPNSEIMLDQYRLAIAEAKTKKPDLVAGDLGFIKRSGVINDETRWIVSLIHDDAKGAAWTAPRTWTWEQEEDFYALLYTPNVRPAAYLISDHPSFRREIKEIRTTPGKEEPLANKTETNTRSGIFEAVAAIDIPLPKRAETATSPSSGTKPTLVPVETDVARVRPRDLPPTQLTATSPRLPTHALFGTGRTTAPAGLSAQQRLREMMKEPTDRKDGDTGT